MIFDDLLSAMIIMPECESAVHKPNSIWASSYVVIGRFKFCRGYNLRRVTKWLQYSILVKYIDIQKLSFFALIANFSKTFWFYGN